MKNIEEFYKNGLNHLESSRLSAGGMSETALPEISLQRYFSFCSKCILTCYSIRPRGEYSAISILPELFQVFFIPLPLHLVGLTDSVFPAGKSGLAALFLYQGGVYFEKTKLLEAIRPPSPPAPQILCSDDGGICAVRLHDDTRQDFEELDNAISSGLYLKDAMNRQGEDFYYMHTEWH